MKSKTGRFILSFDCEGKWGMASDPNMALENSIGDDSLIWAYSAILETLSKRDIAASFGIVGLFSQSLSVFQNFYQHYGHFDAYQSWFKYPLRAFGNGVTDGWFYPSLIDQIRKNPKHEILSHSYTHVPFHEESVSEEIIRIELEQSKSLASLYNFDLETFIYPRNQIKDPDLLREFGIVGFRDNSTASSAYGSKIKTLTNELNIRKKSEGDNSFQTPIRIPSGYFLNWRSGPRLLIPPKITVARFNHLLSHAEKTGGVVHMWLHPHNLITGRQQLSLFENVLDLVSCYRDKGSIEILTMSQYCQQLKTNNTKS